MCSQLEFVPTLEHACAYVIICQHDSRRRSHLNRLDISPTPQHLRTSSTRILMQRLSYLGSTADFFDAGDGVVIKSPMKIWSGNENRRALEAKNAEAISIEQKILERLGHHPRIVPFVLPSPNSVIEAC